MMNQENAYIQRRSNQIERALRLYFGLKQMYHPCCIIALLGLCVGFIFVWRHKSVFYQAIHVPLELESLFQGLISAMIILLFTLLLLGFVERIGVLMARSDEAKLYVAFKVSDLRGVSPILISRKKMKGTANATIREFYTHIPKKRWEEMREELADCMNVTFVHPYIEYGGKHRNKGNRIIIYTVPNRKLLKRGILYDEKI